VEPVSEPFPCLSVEWLSPQRGATVLRVAGELEMYTVPQLRRGLQERILSPESWLILDLSDVRFLDSAGISELVSLYKRFRHQQTICLVPPRGPSGAMLTRMQITRFFVAFSTVAEALHHAAELEIADTEPSDSRQPV